MRGLLLLELQVGKETMEDSSEELLLLLLFVEKARLRR